MCAHEQHLCLCSSARFVVRAHINNIYVAQFFFMCAHGKHLYSAAAKLAKAKLANAKLSKAELLQAKLAHATLVKAKLLLASL